MKIKIDSEKCIGCGSCQAICPGVFNIDDSSKARLKDGKSEGESSEDCVKEAAEVCPVDAIEIKG